MQSAMSDAVRAARYSDLVETLSLAWDDDSIVGDWIDRVSVVNALVTQAERLGKPRNDLVRVLARTIAYLVSRSLFAEALVLADSLVRMQGSLHGPQTGRLAEALLTRAEILYRTAELPQSLAQAEEALGILERLPAPDDITKAAAHMWRAWVLVEQSKTSDALRECLNAREIVVENRSTGKRQIQLELDHQLGVIYWRRGEYQAAVEALQALVNGTSSTEDEAVPTALGLREMAIVKWEWGLVTADQQMLTAALADIDRSISVVSTGGSLNELESARAEEVRGVILAALERLPEAQSALEKVVETRSRLLDGHPSLASALGYLGFVIGLRGEVREGSRRLLHAIAVHEAVYGHNDMRVAEHLTMLGILNVRTGRFGRAAKHFEEAEKILRAIYPTGHPREIPVLSGLVNVCARADIDADVGAFRDRIAVLVSKLEARR